MISITLLVFLWYICIDFALAGESYGMKDFTRKMAVLMHWFLMI